MKQTLISQVTHADGTVSKYVKWENNTPSKIEAGYIIFERQNQETGYNAKLHGFDASGLNGNVSAKKVWDSIAG